jgi:NitT/TauT family transport system permease protein
MVDVEITLQRMLEGLVIGIVAGVAIGIFMGWYSHAYRLLDPLISGTYPLPKIALLPLMLILFGIGNAPIVATVAISTFYSLVINTFQGVRSVDKVLVRMSMNLGSNTRQLLLNVVLPSTLPMIFAGIRIGLGISLLVAISAEFVIGNAGLGYLIWLSWQIYNVQQMYAGLFVCILLGLIFTYPLLYIERRLTPWRQTPNA